MIEFAATRTEFLEPTPTPAVAPSTSPSERIHVNHPDADGSADCAAIAPHRPCAWGPEFEVAFLGARLAAAGLGGISTPGGERYSPSRPRSSPAAS